MALHTISIELGTSSS